MLIATLCCLNIKLMHSNEAMKMIHRASGNDMAMAVPGFLRELKNGVAWLTRVLWNSLSHWFVVAWDI